MNKNILNIIFIFLISYIFGHQNIAQIQDNNFSNKIIIPTKVNTNVQIDGLINESIWDSLNTIDDFVQIEPNFNQMPSKITEVKMFYDDESFYFAVKIFDNLNDVKFKNGNNSLFIVSKSLTYHCSLSFQIRM